MEGKIEDIINAIYPYKIQEVQRRALRGILNNLIEEVAEDIIENCVNDEQMITQGLIIAKYLPNYYKD